MQNTTLFDTDFITLRNQGNKGLWVRHNVDGAEFILHKFVEQVNNGALDSNMTQNKGAENESN